MKDELDQSIGFSRVIDVLSKSKKPIVGHNALLDFVYVFNQFYKPLPPTLAEFKQELVELFPVIYDTKHVALRSLLIEKLNSTGLSSLFEYMRENVKPTPDNLLSSDPRFDGYRAALQAEGDGDEKMLCHEAGFDAFMTGVCFLGLLAHDELGDLPESGTIGSVARLNERLREVTSYKNQLNLMISDERFLDLTNLAQTIDRSRVFRVSSSKRKLHQVRMDDLFQTTKVQRVLREGEQDAFVVLADASYELNAEVAGDLTITPYEQYMASLDVQAKQEKDAADQKLFEQLQSVYNPQTEDAAPFAGLVPTPQTSSTSWSRCTIS